MSSTLVDDEKSSTFICFPYLFREHQLQIRRDSKNEPEGDEILEGTHLSRELFVLLLGYTVENEVCFFAKGHLRKVGPRNEVHIAEALRLVRQQQRWV